MPFAPDIVLHEVTRQACMGYLRQPRHGLLLYGASGVGLKRLALAIAETLNPASDGMMLIEAEEGKDITIEQVRGLYHDTRTVHAERYTVVVDDCERMNIPAQNAFLKLLEEPPASVTFILTSHAPHMLLPTIRSRVAAIEVKSISRQASEQLIASRGVSDPTMVSQLLFLAAGKPAGLLRLIDDPQYFAHRAETMRLARSIVQSSTYQRLILLREAMSDRTNALELVETMGDILAHGLGRAPSPTAARQIQTISDTIDNLQANANVRLQLLSLALAL